VRSGQVPAFSDTNVRSRALLQLRVDLSQKVHRFGGTFVAVRRPTKYADAIIKIHIPPLPLGANGSFPRQGI
jgi:hypothetical protein